MSPWLLSSSARAVEHDAAVFQHIAVIGDIQRDRRALLDDHDGDAELAPDLRPAAPSGPRR